MILFNDLRPAEPVQRRIDTALVEQARSGWHIGGPALARFEAAFAAYCGAAHCAGVGNGLDALHLALRALDIGEGDEVIIASNSYIATVLAVTMAGATPVFVEPDETTFNLDPATVEAAITARTRAILPTHLYGHPADLDPLLAIAQAHGLRLIEDAAQAHGAAYKGRRVGAHGDIVCWSFYPTKNLGALGDGGAVTGNDKALVERVRRLGNYGSDKRYINRERGVNSRLDPIQAAILSVKLEALDAGNARRAAIAERYGAALEGHHCIRRPIAADWATPAWHLYVVTTPDRDALAAFLADRGIETLIHYPIPPHRQEAYGDLGIGPGVFPIAERLADSVLSLPIGPHLNDDAVETVCAALREFGQ